MKFKVDALVQLYLQENSDEKKNELPTGSKDLDNPTYGLFKKLGCYTTNACLICLPVTIPPIPFSVQVL